MDDFRDSWRLRCDSAPSHRCIVLVPTTPRAFYKILAQRASFSPNRNSCTCNTTPWLVAIFVSCISPPKFETEFGTRSIGVFDRGGDATERPTRGSLRPQHHEWGLPPARLAITRGGEAVSSTNILAYLLSLKKRKSDS